MLDHGILNVPLAKRGNIDNQIDKYKREQEAARKAIQKSAAATQNVSKAEAKRILAALEAAPGLLEETASNRGISRKELLSLLKDIVSSKPRAMLAFERDWLSTEKS